MSYKIVLKKEANLDKLKELTKEIAEFFPSSAIVLLKGNLAAGKTTLVSKFVELLNQGAEVATSPTFALQQIYGDTIFHYDFYRVDFSELVNLGLLEEFEKEGYHFVEWASEELVDLLLEAGFEVYSIEINNLGSSREYILRKLNA